MTSEAEAKGRAVVFSRPVALANLPWIAGSVVGWILIGGSLIYLL
jgi:hypothetical protein